MSKVIRLNEESEELLKKVKETENENFKRLNYSIKLTDNQIISAALKSYLYIITKDIK